MRLLFLLGLLVPAFASAQEALPQLLSGAPAVYPPDALTAGQGASVLLDVALDETGRVLDAALRTPAREGCEGAELPCESPAWAAFDAAALAAIRDFRFTPARDAEGNPAPAVIVWRFSFEATRAPALALDGVVRDDAGAPLAEADVQLTGPDGAVRSARTDAEGRFQLAGLAPGPWSLSASALFHASEVATFEVREGAVAQVELALTATYPSGDDPGTTIEVVAERRTSAVTERTLGTEEIQFLPGTGGDVVRAVQNLPGVARAALGTGQLIIRGTPPEDSRYYLDGSPVPIIFHFAGFSTVLNADSIAEVAYLPGNYSVRYGRTLGGVVDLRTRQEGATKPGAYVSADLIQATAFVEAPLGKGWSLAMSGRRSYVDAILNPILSGGSSTVRAPRYYDAQGILRWEGSGGARFDLLGLYSDDRFEVVGTDEDGESSVSIGLDTTFARLRARWLVPLPGGWENELVAYAGPDNQGFRFTDEAEASEQRFALGLREEVHIDATPTFPFGARLGAELSTGREAFVYDVEAFSPYEADEDCFFGTTAYGELEARVGPVTLFPGTRIDSLWLTSGYWETVMDPRVSARWLATEGTVVTGGLGRFSQFPIFREVATGPDADGNPDLVPERSLQASLAVQQRLPFGLSAEVTGFHNWLDELVVGREDRIRFFTGPPPVGPFDTEPYANEGSGRVFGVESLVRLDLPRTLGLLSATWTRSYRTGRDGEEKLFASDQPFVLTALASQELGKGWRLGGRLRVGSGNPYTPVVNRVYDQESRSWFPVYGEADSARLPTFYALDLRVDKEWRFRRWTLTTYLDLQNATNAQNPEVMAWTWDYAEEDPITGLPILPSLGLKGSFGGRR